MPRERGWPTLALDDDMIETVTTFVLESREQLLNGLAEAAEVEHNLMCCYLYAAFSLKEGLDEDLTEPELAAVKRWRYELIHIAVGEMTHLTLVANLMSAIGGVPNLGRGNFPIAAGYHPAGIVVKLAPFAAETLDHFIYLERPEGVHIADGAGFEADQHYRRLASPGRLAPSNGDYATVGALYRAIADGFKCYAARHGEAALFVGDPQLQLGPDVANLPGLVRVRCLATADAAIEQIVVEGEGSPASSERSHFQRFRSIRRELESLRAARPGFVPARPAAQNPVMRAPPTPQGRVWITALPAANLLDLVNAVYVHMLRLLMQAYAESRGATFQREMTTAATELMYAITPVASALTRLPANHDCPGTTAGMSFAVPHQRAALAAGPTADRVLIERLDEILSRALLLSRDLAWLSPVVARMKGTRDRLRDSLGQANEARLVMSARSETESTVHADVAPQTPQESPPDSGPRRMPVDAVPGAALTILYDNERCIHARHCVLEQPAAFKANVPGKWIDADAATTEGLVTLAHMCPSGAIQYSRNDGGQEEQSPPVNLIQLRENGPLGFRAELFINDDAAGYRATLCRCGASQHKPFCDNSHATASFQASGEPSKRESQPLPTRNGRLDVRPQPNGPLVVEGNVELCSGTGRTIERTTAVRLCRCGASANKPFCDGSHARIGFQAD
jgi:CDGSH-type Zn-finger protein/uncharacterized Fe-S cluster protein YjdI